jgi:acetylornithine deacetylase/succinyl-diaminopimelate desuccinylase-like protein
MLEAGYKSNVIPERASAVIDGRFLPGGQEEFLAVIDELAGPGVTREDIHLDRSVESPFGTPLVETMLAALRAEDPAARTVPYCLSAGTDNKTFAELGMTGYGFVPLRLTPDLDFAAMFHGVDERVPVSALDFGARVLDRFLGAA